MRCRILCAGLILSLSLTMGGISFATESVTTETSATLSQSSSLLTAAQAEAIGLQHSATLPAGIIYEVDGQMVDDPYLEVYNSTTYVSLRTIVAALRPDATVSWNGSSEVVYAEGLSMTVTPGKSYLEANGRALPVADGIRQIDGAVLVPIRVAVEALGASLTWDESAQLISVTSGTGAIVSGDDYYNQDVLYWLSRIIQAESGSESLEGKLGVGTVIYNRVDSSRFPNTVYEVIFQTNQFSPASNGYIYNTPNTESVLAAKLCMEGVRVAEGSLYFFGASTASSSWVRNSLTYVTTIGNHYFYQ